MVLERALIQASEVIQPEFVDLISRILDSRDSRFAHGATCRVSISWKPLSLTFSKVNFDGSVINSNGGVDFVIKGAD